MRQRDILEGIRKYAMTYVQDLPNFIRLYRKFEAGSEIIYGAESPQ